MSNQSSSSSCGATPFVFLGGLDDDDELDLNFDLETTLPDDIDELYDFVVSAHTALMPQFCVDCNAFVDQPSLHFSVLHGAN